jgi:hypothetical protein
MQRKQQVGECWVCVIFFARVCVGASDSITVSDDPNFLFCMFHVHRSLPRGVLEGLDMPPPGYAQHPTFFYGRILLFLAVL